MKRFYLCCICLLFVFSLVLPTGAETKTLPTINSLLRSGNTGLKTEVRDNLDAYSPFNGTFEDIDKDFKILILQREAPEKQFTSKKTYPPFTNEDGFDEDFEGVDIGSSRLWLRSDLMALLPSVFCAASLEDANYLLVAESMYEWAGTISVSDFKDSGDEELPEFKDAEEMESYFLKHPKIIESITYYPKFGAYSLITLYDTKTKKGMLIDYTYNEAKRFARNPAACDHWSNMNYVEKLLNVLDEELSIDVTTANTLIENLEFIPQEKKDLWNACINAKEYSTAHHSISDFFWSMAAELRELDASKDHKEKYDLIINERNRQALNLFVNYCEYSGFDRSVSSIELSKDYIASPDHMWMDRSLRETVLLFTP